MYNIYVYINTYNNNEMNVIFIVIVINCGKIHNLIKSNGKCVLETTNDVLQIMERSHACLCVDGWFVCSLFERSRLWDIVIYCDAGDEMNERIQNIDEKKNKKLQNSFK